MNSEDNNRDRELLEAIYASTERTRKYILFTFIIQIAKVVLVLLVIFFIFIFLAPELKTVLDIYTGRGLDF